MIRLLITSGRGPAECRVALGHVLSALMEEAETLGIAIDVAHGPQVDKHGPSSAIAILDGEGDALFARQWLGSILWVAPSPLRPSHKRKNWFVGVLPLPDVPVVAGTKLVLADVRFETFRAGGPGGQHQNKTESAVRAVHAPSGLAVVARDGRSQHRNKALALDRLAALLASQVEMAGQVDKVQVQSAHDQLARGSAVRRFVGPRFKPG